METYFKQADPLPVTSGNVFEPVAFGTTVHGGWSKVTKTEKKSITAAFVLGGVVASIFLLKKLKK